MVGPAPQKKHHHYIPIAYLAAFADPAGKVFAYRKDEPFAPLHLKPRNIAFEQYYYSQRRPDGGRDNETLENLFSRTESHWPGIVRDLAAGHDLGARLSDLYEFMGMMRVRVPAARDPVELALASDVSSQARRMQGAGQLPPMPEGVGDLLEQLVVSIDPHMSLHAMGAQLKQLAGLIEALGFQVAHNASEEPFITSDNPVIWFDPDVSEDRLQPYPGGGRGRRVELLMPLTPRLLLRAHSDLPRPLKGGVLLPHVEWSAAADVERVNRLVAKFAYRFVFAGREGYGELVSRFAGLVPTVRFDSLPGAAGLEPVTRMVFGPRPRKPRWDPGPAEA